MVGKLAWIEKAVDIGAGSGRDLALVKQHHPHATAVAIEAKTISRVASSLFPTMASSHPSRAQFETNFWAGPYAAEGGTRD